MQHYELMVIFTPTLAESDYKAIITKYLDLLSEEKGALVESESWGLKNLAYPIKKKTVGFYWLLTYKVNPENVTAFDAAFRTALWRDENILRYMITKLDKDALAYNLSRIEKAKSAASQKREESRKVAETKKDDVLLVDDIIEIDGE